LYGQSTAVLETYYDKYMKEQMGFTEQPNNVLAEKNKEKDSNFEKYLKDYFINIDAQSKSYSDDHLEDTSKFLKSYSSECQICIKIRDTLANQTYNTQIRNKLNGLNNAYNSKRNTYAKELETQLSNITTQQTIFADNTKQIQQMQKKIRLAHDLLNAQASKLQSFGESLNSLQAQYKQRGKSRVTIGLPYLPPFFTMSSRNFLLMMIFLKLILLVVIFVYAFYGRVKYTANVNKNDTYQNLKHV